MIMLELSAEERRLLMLSVGTHKGVRPLSPVEVARLIKKALSNDTTTPESLAQALHLEGPTMISRFTRLLPLAPEIQHLVDWGSSDGTVGFSAAFELARLESYEDQSALAAACLKHSLSSTEARQIVQLVYRSKRRVSECIAEVVGMRPTTDVRHVFIGAVLDELLRQQLGARTQAERDFVLKRVMDEKYPHLDVKSARLGVDRFTLVGGDNLGVAAGASLEAELNAELTSRGV